MPAIRTSYPAPIAYTYDAAHHCPDCAARAFGVDEDGWIPETARDSEGNEIGAVSPWDEWIEPSEAGKQTLACDTCSGIIAEYEPDEPEPVTRYVVIENTPGYLPDDDDPPVFDTSEDAKSYMHEEVERYCDFLAEGYDYDETYEPVVWWNRDLDAAHVSDPRRIHDLGRNFAVEVAEDDDSERLGA